MKKPSLSMFAILGLFVSFCAQAQTAASSSQAGQPSRPHVVPTNLPGVYAFAQPPAGFDPLAASRQDLEAWGYPPRPEVSEGPKDPGNLVRRSQSGLAAFGAGIGEQA
jgi:hypothetical protein